MAIRRLVRGTEAKHERNRSIVRDSRSFSDRFSNAMEKPENVAVSFAALAAGAFLIPMVPVVVWGAAALALSRYVVTRPGKLPMRLPVMTARKDYGSLDPKGLPKNASGIALLGYDRTTKQQVWISNDDARRHMLYLATTGGGKTEALLSLITNAFAWASGFCFVDGKADTTLYAKIYSLAVRYGRVDDVLVINYLKGGGEEIESNTSNPFASGSDAELTELLVSLMDGAGGTNGDMWKGRAISLISAVLRALTYLRDGFGLELSVSVIREYLTLPKVIELAKRTDLPRIALDGLDAYLKSLPGYRPNITPDKIPNDTTVQHGYLQMQFTRVLGELADTYGRIFGPRISDIDMFDVVSNRRILIVMLPALEKSEDALRQLGKIIIAMTKIMMSKALGSKIRGATVDIIGTKPTTSESPFFVILDECGYYLSPDAALMAAQARSLGFSLVFATQDLPSLKAGLKEKADSILGNTSFKLIGKVEDPNDTLNFAIRRASKVETLVQSTFEEHNSASGNSFVKKTDANVSERERINPLDIFGQLEGEYHMFAEDKLVRINTFYANPVLVDDIRTNIKIPLAPPEPASMTRLEDDVDLVLVTMRSGISLQPNEADYSPELAMMGKALRAETTLTPMDRACGALAAMGALDRGAELPREFAEMRDRQLAVNEEMTQEIDGAVEALPIAASDSGDDSDAGDETENGGIGGSDDFQTVTDIGANDKPLSGTSKKNLQKFVRHKPSEALAGALQPIQAAEPGTAFQEDAGLAEPGDVEPLRSHADDDIVEPGSDEPVDSGAGEILDAVGDIETTPLLPDSRNENAVGPIELVEDDPTSPLLAAASAVRGDQESTAAEPPTTQVENDVVEAMIDVTPVASAPTTVVELAANPVTEEIVDKMIGIETATGVENEIAQSTVKEFTQSIKAEYEYPKSTAPVHINLDDKQVKLARMRHNLVNRTKKTVENTGKN